MKRRSLALRSLLLSVACLGMISAPCHGEPPAGAKTRATLKGHQSRVQSIAFSPDGALLASASRDRTIKLWRVATGKLEKTLEGHLDRVQAVVFSPDGKTLASASADKTVRVWSVESGESQQTLLGHKGAVACAVFSPDGKTIASGGEDGAIRFWNVQDGKLVQSLDAHEFSVLSLTFAPNGARLASGSQDTTIKLWDVKTGDLQATLRGHSGWLTQVGYSPDGKLLASGSNDGTIKIWDPASGQLKSSLEAHAVGVTTVAFSPDGKTLASGGKDRLVRLWDVGSGKTTATIEGHEGWLSGVAFSPDQKTLATSSSDATVRLWDLLAAADVQVAEAKTDPPRRPAPEAPPGTETALSFNGQDQFVEIPKLTYDGTHPITIESFITPLSANPQNTPGTPHVAHSFGSVVANTQSGGVDLQVLETGFNFQVRGGDRYVGARTRLSPFAASRVHLAGVFDGKEVRLYVGGKLAAKTMYPGDFKASTLNFMVGANPHATSRTQGEYKGLIDEVRISKVARYTDNFTPAKRFEPDKDTLVLYHFDEGEGDIAHDASANKLDGKIFGAQWIQVDTSVKTGNAPAAANEQPAAPAVARPAAALVDPFGDAVADVPADAVPLLVPAQSAVSTPPATAARPDRPAAKPSFGFPPLPLGVHQTPKEDASLANQPWESLFGHAEEITSLAYSPDGKILASASGDNTVGLWDVAQRRLRVALRGHVNKVLAVAFSSDGSMVASAGADKTVRLWDTETGQLQRTLSGHTQSVGALAFSPDGKKLASGGEDKLVKIWDWLTGRELASMSGHAQLVTCLLFTADSATLVSGSADATLAIWDAAKGEQRVMLHGHIDRITSLAFSPDEKVLASGSWDKTVKLWDVADGMHLATMRGHWARIHSIAFADDGKTLASAGQDRSIRLWDVEKAEIRARLDGMQPVSALAYSPDNKALASAGLDPEIKLWRLPIEQSVMAADSAETPSAVDFASQFPGTIRVGSGGVRAAVLTPDQKTVIAAGPGANLRYFDAKTGELVANLPGHTRTIWTLAISPDGKKFATADRVLKVWDFAKREELGTLEEHTEDIKGIAFSPDGKLLVAASRDDSVSVWDAETLQKVFTFRQHQGGVYHVAFSPDGKLVATGGTGKTVRLWEPRTGKQHLELAGHPARIRSLCFSPDGKLLATGDEQGVVKIWDLVEGKEKHTLPPEAGTVYALAFQGDGKTLLTGGADGAIRLWNVETGKLNETLTGHQNGILWLALRPEAKTLISSAKDGTVRRWPFAMKEKHAARYNPPSGDVAELVSFIADMQTLRPKSFLEHKEHQLRAPTAERAAAERIRELAKDQDSAATRLAKRIVIRETLGDFAEQTAKQREQMLKDVAALLASEKAPEVFDASLAVALARQFEGGGDLTSATAAYRQFAAALAKSEEPGILRARTALREGLKRLDIIGEDFVISGSKTDGQPLDWNAYRGKTVLVTLGKLGDQQYRQQLGYLRMNYDLYHAHGFEVVTVCQDVDLAVAARYLQREGIPWPVLLGANAKGNEAFEAQKGLTTGSTSLRIDKEGKVAAISVRLDQLGSSLERILGQPLTPKGKLSFVDLQPHFTVDLTTGSSYEQNNLQEMETGEQTLGGVKFQIHPRYVQLGSKQLPDLAVKATGIKINQQLARLYLLHGAKWGNDGIPEGAIVGRYEIHYEDGTNAVFPLVYGKDVRDWWNNDGGKPVSRGKVAWVGLNAVSRNSDRMLRVYLAKWENPHPDKKVVSLDYIATNTTNVAPFCLAITAESSSPPAP